MNLSAPVNPEFPSNKLINDAEKLLTEKLNQITKTIPFNPKSRYDTEPEYFKLKVVDRKIVLTIADLLKNHSNAHVIPEQIRQINIELNKVDGDYQLKLMGSIINTRDGTTTYTITIEQRQEQYQNLVEEAIEQ